MLLRFSDLQRKQGFQLELPKLQEIKLVTNSMQQVYVNGLPNTEIAKRYPNFQNLAQLPLQELENGNFLKIELNNYIYQRRDIVVTANTTLLECMP